MNIYTTYFAKLNALPDDIVPISIAAKPPRGYVGAEFKTLAPSYDILMEYKYRGGSQERYTTRFSHKILAPLFAENVVGELSVLACGKDFALVCYEKPDDFCHRHLIAEWLEANGYPCKEYEFAKFAKKEEPIGEELQLKLF